MRSKVTCLLAAALTMGTVQIASAADMPVKAPAYVPPPVYNWTGFYVGVNAGYAWGRSDISAVPNAPFVADFPTTAAFIAANHPGDLDSDGFIGGGQIGYNFQTGNWVFGLEGDFNYFHLDDSFAFGANPVPTTVVPLSVSGNVSTRWLATIRPRLGYALDRWLVYVTGGLAITELEYSESISVVGAATGLGVYNGSVSDTRAGWTIGVGTEWAFAPNWSAKLEYLYMDFGSVDVIAPRIGAVPPVTPGPAFAYSADLRANVVRLGLNYKFY